MTPDFTAVTTCPRCGHTAYHWLEEPPAPPEIVGWTEEVCRVYGGNYGEIVRMPTYATGGDMTAHHINTDNSTVMRTCRQCEHAWGEK